MPNTKALLAAGRAAALLLPIVFALPAAGQDIGLRGPFEADLALGVMTGTAYEHVYNGDGSDLSRLDWVYDNTVMLKGGIHYGFWDWLGVGVRGRIALTDDSYMEDYDWGLLGCPGGNCISIHDKTYLRASHAVDVYVDSSLYDIGFGVVGATAGYKWDTSKWEAWGGIANYALFGSELGISYQQWWEAPYIGVTLEGELERFTWSGRLIGSWWASGNDEDTHHLRDLLFEESFEGSTMWELNASLGYLLTDNIEIQVNYDYQEWMLAKGSTWITDLTTGARTYIPGDSAGASNATQTVSAGVKVNF